MPDDLIGKSVSQWDPHGPGTGTSEEKLMATEAKELPDEVNSNNVKKQYMGKKPNYGEIGKKGHNF